MSKDKNYKFCENEETCKNKDSECPICKRNLPFLAVDYYEPKDLEVEK